MLHPFLHDRGKNEEAGIRFRQQEVAQRTLARESPRESRRRPVARCPWSSRDFANPRRSADARAPRCASSEAKFFATVDLPSFGSTEMTPTTFGLRSPSDKSTRDLGGAQGLGEAGERMIDRIPLQRIRRMNSPRILASRRFRSWRSPSCRRPAACPENSRPSSSRTCDATRNTRSRYSRSAPRPEPTMAPNTSDSARTRPRLG